MGMSMKARLKRVMPPRLYNWVMLAVPHLQRLPMVNYESNLDAAGLEDMRYLLGQVAALEGHIIECGSSRCGTSILIARYLATLGLRKNVYALDSYEGFEPEELERERNLGLANVSPDAFTSTSYQYVVQKIRKLGYGNVVVPIKGFFEDTLPDLAASTAFCFAFVDCDLRDSMAYCAQTLWPNLVAGGMVAFDDYPAVDFKGARLAVDEFVSEKASEITEHRLLRRLYYVRKGVS